MMDSTKGNMQARWYNCKSVVIWEETGGEPCRGWGGYILVALVREDL